MDDSLFQAVVPSEFEGRLDLFLTRLLKEQSISREKIKKAIKNGKCLLSGKVCANPDEHLHSGEEIVFQIPQSETDLVPEEGNIEIIYKDEHLLVVNKPAGLTVHPAAGCTEGTLVHRLVAHFPELQKQGGLRPGIVHRLDKDTSGLLCIALTEKARLRLIALFASRQIHKEYLALILGVPESCLCRLDTNKKIVKIPEKNSPLFSDKQLKSRIAELTSYFEGWSKTSSAKLPHGSIDLPLGRHPSLKTRMAVRVDGKEALSDWQILYKERHDRYALVAVCIHTGRTHQIRVHMEALGHPLLGDKAYGSKYNIMKLAPRQMLHAWKLTLPHPITDEMLQFSCPPPEDFLQTAFALEKTMLRVVVTSVAGCGKSAVMDIFKEQGIPIWNADAAVIRLYEPGKAGWRALRDRFGDRFIDSDTAAVNRAALAAALLPPELQSADKKNDSEEIVNSAELNRLIHPLVLEDLDQFWTECAAQEHALAVAEVPLWFESGGEPETKKDFDKPLLLGIACPEEERKRRLLEIRGWSPELMTYMDSQQWAQDKKMSACDKVIVNDGSLEDLHEKVVAFLKSLGVD